MSFNIFATDSDVLHKSRDKALNDIVFSILPAILM